MIFNLLNGKSKTIASAAALVAFMSLLSRLVGLFRDRILAGQFGAGDTLDVYYAAFRIPDLIFTLLITGALSASFIPLFTKRLLSEQRSAAAWRLTNNVINLVGIGFLIAAVFGAIFSSGLSAIIAPGFDAYKQSQVAELMRVMFISSFLLGLSTVFGSALQGLKRFFLFSAAPVLYNLGIIVGILFFVRWWGPSGLAWGVVLGAGLHFLSQLYGAKQSGYRYCWLLNFRDADTREIGRLMIPRTLGLGIWQVNFIIMTIIASTLAAGSVAIFQFAFNLEYFAIGVFGISFAIAAFPSLSEYAEAGATDKFIETFSNTVRQMLFFIVPASLVFLILRAQIVRVVLGAGVFDWQDTILTADVLAFFTLSFFAQALIFLLVRGYFAYHDTATPLYTGAVSALINILAALYFTREFGVVGLGIAYSLWAVINMIMLWLPLRRRVGHLDEERILRSLFIMTTAGVVSGVVMQVMKSVAVRFIGLETLGGVLAQGLLAGGSGLLVYFGVSWLARSPELRSLVAGLRLRFLRKARTEETINEAAGM